MSANINCIPLESPPKAVDQLSGNGNLLAAWRMLDQIIGEDGLRYHFALHSSAFGWLAYRWDEQYGRPWKVFPVALSNTVWAYTTTQHLIRLRIRPNGETSITATAQSSWLFDANENTCLVKEITPTIRLLRFDKDGDKTHDITLNALIECDWAHIMPDGAVMMALYYGKELVMLSPEGKIIHAEICPYAQYFHFRPFVVRCARNYLYYTDDPRQGWRRAPVLKAHRERTGASGSPAFFTVLGDMCYTVIRRGENDVALYRSSTKLPVDAELMEEIQIEIWTKGIVQHNGFICMVAKSSAPCDANARIPENDGFLVWHPVRNTFYADIPRTMSVHRISAGRASAIHIPGILERASHITKI